MIAAEWVVECYIACFGSTVRNFVGFVVCGYFVQTLAGIVERSLVLALYTAAIPGRRSLREQSLWLQLQSFSTQM